NYYFVDTLYKAYYEPFYNNEPPQVNGATQIVEEEVWVQRLSQIPDPTERQGVAIINLQARPTTGYQDSTRNSQGPPGIAEIAPFVKLDRLQYELFGDR